MKPVKKKKKKAERKKKKEIILRAANLPLESLCYLKSCQINNFPVRRNNEQKTSFSLKITAKSTF